MKTFNVKSILKWLKIFTYISGIIFLLANNNAYELALVLPVALLVSVVNFSRDYWLIPENKRSIIVNASILVEILLIICLGFIDKNEINILFFFVCISSVILSSPFIYSIFLAVAYSASGFLIHLTRYGLDSLIDQVVPMLFNYSVSTAFVMGMSLLVKLQIHEKEKLARINAELEQAYKKLIENSAAAEKLTIEQERTRMARELHDTLAHTLTSLIVQLEACKRLAALEPNRLPAELEKAQELSRSGFNDIKRSLKALRPLAMEDRSFNASILSTIRDTMENTKINIIYNNSLPEDIALTSHTEVALFRIIQESITNSIRHGHAGEIEISISKNAKSLQLSIFDNGKGCSNIKKGYGIKGIRERAEALKGSAEFTSSPDKGFKTRITIPYEVA